MQITVKLQNMFSYSVLPIIVLLAIIVICFFYLVILTIKPKQISENKTQKIPEKNIKNKSNIKKKYLSQLDSVEYKFDNQKISLRQAYQDISGIIRMFVFEVTDIKTQNYSLNELKSLNMPDLYNLIEEYYLPEFSSKPEGDFKSSISKARGIINKWN